MKLMENMEQSENEKIEKKKMLLLVQDLNYSKNLATNNEKVRRRSLKYLEKYLQQRSEADSLTEENFKVLWKGLFFSMWMSDKPLVQEECAENIANLIHCLSFKHAIEFFRVGLLTLQNEWFGIDQLRIDKFMMFVRRCLRQMFIVLKKLNFKKYSNQKFGEVLQSTILSTEKVPPMGLLMHFIEIYLEELAKISDGKLQSPRVIDFIQPFIARLAFATDKRIIEWINKFIFTHLMKQHKLGLEYEEKYKAWRAQRFAGSINQIQKVIVSDEETGECEEVEAELNHNKPLDPRAGRVDVVLPQIKFNSKDISEMFLQYKSDSKTTKHTRLCLNQWSNKFDTLYKGSFPLGIKTLKTKKNKKLDSVDTNVTKAAKRLIKFEQQLLAKERKVTKRKKGPEENNEAPVIKKKKIDSSEKHKKSKAIESSIDELPHNINEVKKSKKNTGLGSQKLMKKCSTPKENVSLEFEKYDFCFTRNSGVWFVTPENSKKCSEISKKPAEKSISVKEIENQVSPSNTKLPEKLKNESKEIKEPGEYEIFIPSKKYMKKLKKAKGYDEVAKAINQLRGKSKVHNVSNRREDTPMPPRIKKVKINTKMNMSADLEDHIQQVMSSPQIPFDSTKKPGKSLLKTPIKTSPINPFYKLKLF